MILEKGSYYSIFSKRSIPFESRLVTYLERGVDYHLGKVNLKSGSYETPGHIDSLGVP